MENCTAWLKRHLAPGASECSGVREAAVEAGFTCRELKAARKELGVKTWHQVDEYDGQRIDNWFWYLPENRA